MLTDNSSPRKKLLGWTGWFLLINFFLISILLGRYLKYTNDIESITTAIYMAGVISSHTISLIFLSFIVIFLPLIILIPRPKLIKFIGITAAGLAYITLNLDFEVYSQYRFHINSMVLDLVVQGGGDVFSFSFSTYLISFIIIIAAFLVGFAGSKAADKLNESSITVRHKWVYALISIALIICVHFAHMVADAKYYRPLTTISKHIPLFRPLTGKKFLDKHGIVDLNENWKIQKKNSAIIQNSEINYPLNPLKFNDSKKMNFLYIVIDSWRFDTMDSFVTPNLSAFKEKYPTQNFMNHTSSGNGTRVGIFGLFYGMFGSYWNSMETNQIGSLLIKSMVDKDYEMGIFASAKLTAPAFNQTVFRDIDNLRVSTKGETSWEKDKNIVDEWLEWDTKRDRKKPFFGFLFFDSPHVYGYKPDYKQLYKQAAESIDYHKFKNDYDPTPIFKRYKNAVNYTDSLIKNVLERVEKSGMMENTIIVITGDHGQEINDNKQNFWGHGSNYTKYQIQVPLVIYWPGKEEKTYTHLTNHIDITPTFMKEALACENPIEDYSNGRNLFDTSERKWIYSGGGLSTDAIIEKDRITEILNTGVYEIYNPDYSVLKGAKLNTSILRDVFREKSRFYK